MARRPRILLAIMIGRAVAANVPHTARCPFPRRCAILVVRRLETVWVQLAPPWYSRWGIVPRGSRNWPSPNRGLGAMSGCGLPGNDKSQRLPPPRDAVLTWVAAATP